jgi:tRNA dimethylallyltransferase
VGKSRLAIEMALKFKGEIVNADSRQVYRYMDIGTAKPTDEELQIVPHHLFNILNPDDNFGLAQYIQLAGKAIKNIQDRGGIPFLVGGSGQYIWSLLEGWEIPPVAPDTLFRKSLEDIAASGEVDKLYNELITIDPQAALKIDKRNVRRVIRALEVSIQAKEPFSKLKKKNPPDYKTLIIGLTAERSTLYKKVDIRVDKMFELGLLDEVKTLNLMGYDFQLPSLNTIGYKQIGQVQSGELIKDELANKIKTDTHRFIRHQYAWFKLDDERITWFKTSTDIEYEVIKLVSDWLDSD